MCITIEDDTSDVELVKVVKTPTKKFVARSILKQPDARERLLKFHEYILKVTKLPIYDNDEIYRN